MTASTGVKSKQQNTPRPTLNRIEEMFRRKLPNGEPAPIEPWGQPLLVQQPDGRYKYPPGQNDATIAAWVGGGACASSVSTIRREVFGKDMRLVPQHPNRPKRAKKATFHLPGAVSPNEEAISLKLMADQLAQIAMRVNTLEDIVERYTQPPASK